MGGEPVKKWSVPVTELDARWDFVHGFRAIAVQNEEKRIANA
jgi:hypothetical protein